MMIRPNFVVTDSMAADLVLTGVLSALLLGVFLIGVWIMLSSSKFNRSGIVLSLLVAVGVGLSSLLIFGPTLTAFKGMLLGGILLYASLLDLRFREVPDFVSVMLLILAFVGFEPSHLPSMIVGAVIVFIPQIALAVMRPSKAVGGADIKISTAVAFLLGAEKGLFALIIGLLIAVVTVFIMQRAKLLEKGKAFPLVPFLAIGTMIAYMI